MQGGTIKAYMLVKDLPIQVQNDNIKAAAAVASIIKTCLGPRAMQKMVMTRIGSIELTNDGNAILREIDVAHPATKAIIEIARTQDDEVGDGTTSVIILVSEILQNLSDLLFSNVHPIRICHALSKALNLCLESLKSITVDLKKDESEKLAIIKNCVGTKLCSILGVKIEILAMKAIKIAMVEEFGTKKVDLKNDIKIEKILGSDFNESEVLNGLILNKNVVHPQMRRRIENPRILVLDAPLEYKKGESQTAFEFSSAESFKRALEVEEEQIAEMCANIIAAKPDIVLTEKGISDLAMAILYKNNITAIRRLKKTETSRMVKACGGYIINRLADIPEGAIGKNCGLFEYVKYQDEYYSKFTKCKNPKACSVILRGPSKDLLNELERNFHDAVKVGKNIVLHPKMCPGGGGTEMYLSTILEKFKGTEIEEKVIKRLAEALKCIPSLLAKNCGHSSPLDLIGTLDKRIRENKFCGIDGNTGEIIDVRGKIMEPMIVKSQMLKSAFEAAIINLRIDGIIQSIGKK